MALQGGLLVSRTLLTDVISRIEGFAGRAITSLVGARPARRGQRAGPTPAGAVRRQSSRALAAWVAAPSPLGTPSQPACNYAPPRPP